MNTRRFLAAMLVLPILAASHVRASTSAKATVDKGQAVGSSSGGQALLDKGKADWFAMRTTTAEQELIAATKNPATAAEAHYWLGRIYDFKGNKAEGAFPGFHEEVSYRPRAEAEFKAAGTPKPEWIAEGEAFDESLKDADHAIEKLQSGNAPAHELRFAIERRIALRPDPPAYISNGNLLIAHKAELLFVAVMAQQGLIDSHRFIHENESSYKLDGKVQAFLERNDAALADNAGWALYLSGQSKIAEIKLAEASRLYRNLDATNQLHLAELSANKNDLDTARDHYLTALSLAAITPQQRDRAKTALAAVEAQAGENPAGFEAWLVETLESRRDDRRKALLGTMAGRKLPDVVLHDLQGRTIDLRAERGNVLMLSFFSAWCGACKVEMPLIQKAYEKYDGAPGVKFILVSLDDDPARLDRYAAERKFAMPVARYTREQAAAVFSVHDTPTTFYVDKSGTIQYQVTGIEPHGDAVERVTWYIEHLKARQ